MNTDSLIVAGVMSGTSADGINVALVQVDGGNSASAVAEAVQSDPAQHHQTLHIKLLGHTEHPYPSRVRSAVLAAMNATRASVADLAGLNVLLGELYADAVLAAQQRFRTKVDLIGCHGQTLYHQGDARPFLGRKIACTWQAGEAAILAARTQTPVVSNFRPADMAAGGKGAPLVPLLDMLLFRHRSRTRVAQNLGGIGNLTVVPA